MSIKGKNIIVTGGSGGIGSEIIKVLLSKGANVYYTYHTNVEVVDKIKNIQKMYDGKAYAYQVDIRESSSIEAFVKDVLHRTQRIDVLVNNAGLRRDRSLLLMSKKEWDEVISANLSGLFQLTHEIILPMLKAESGRIINISSISGINGLAGQTNYSASKAGIIGFTRALAKEVAHKGISVNAIAPGPVQTKMLDGLSDEKIRKMVETVPMMRMCDPNEVAMAVNTLADEELMPAYYTGQVLILDGGMGL